jgi:3-deoxy-D-manno-octulosonic-acid transferase
LAELHSKSQRQLPIARQFFGRLFDCFDRIGAIGEADRARFRSIGARGEILITGDTRTDQVIHRYEEADEGSLQRALNGQDFRYLALGSIWPADEKVILEPVLDRLDQDSSLGLIAVPHEPTPAHLESIESAMRAHGLMPSRLSELVEPRTHVRRATAAAKDPNRWRAIVVDTVGALAEIYRATILSYVGGSFTTGVHNTLEPAIVGQPVLFGPRIQNAHEAELLVERGGAFVVESRTEAAAQLADLLESEERRQTVGAIAANFVLSQRGATQASVELLRPYVFESDL